MLSGLYFTQGVYTSTRMRSFLLVKSDNPADVNNKGSLRYLCAFILTARTVNKSFTGMTIRSNIDK
ncbi:hypothetical protein GCM10011607_13070 [Shewanella inventionis]|uniref:Uncharacterized protein n=1 Tax=Shewanella inventionis TaxID=1738770 RepID=A0ABQ1IW11_9GAMM|nr:hypothetical protein GCM10011607_13070 [Shewanella inventionis]